MHGRYFHSIIVIIFTVELLLGFTTASYARYLVADSTSQFFVPNFAILPGGVDELATLTIPVSNTPAPRIQHNGGVVHKHSVHVPVLMYHYIRYMHNPEDKQGYLLSVTPDNFEKQMAYLRDSGFTTITPEDLYNAIFTRTQLPKKPILLTFDDGYQDFYSEARRILDKYNLKATIFIPVDRISTPNYLTWPELYELARNPNITIASHTRHHYNLTDVPISQLDNEIRQSRGLLEKHIGRSIDYFAYPYGGYNEEAIKEVKRANYKLAFSTINGATHTMFDQYTIKRITISGTYDLQLFASVISH